MSDYEDRGLEGNSDSERVGNTDWCGCEVWMSLSERECSCFHERDILKENIEVEDVDCVTQHMDLDITCPNHSIPATSYAAFMQLNGIGVRARAIYSQQQVVLFR